jgi:hypothetical protein
VRRAVITVALLLLIVAPAHARWADTDRFGDAVRAQMWPQAAYDDVGRGFVAWTSITTGLVPYWPEVAMYDGTAWSTPVRIGGATSLMQPGKIVAAGDGHAAIEMSDVTGGGSKLLVARYIDGRWGDPVQLSDPGAATSVRSLAITAAGEVVVGWIEDGTRIRAARFADGFWSTADVGPVSAANELYVVIDGSGVPMIAWTDTSGSGTGWFTSRRLSGAWSVPALAVEPGSGGNGSALVLVGGQPLLVWGRTLAPGPNWRSVVEAAHFDGTRWSAVETVAQEARSSGIGAASLRDGSAMAVWTAGTGGLDFDVRVARRTAAGWSAPAQVNSTDGAFESTIAAFGADGAIVGWRWYDTPYAAVLTGGTWTTTKLGADQSADFEPAVAGSRDGSALAAWENGLVSPFVSDVRRLVDVPGPPLAASATASDAEAAVSWSAPLLTNGSRVVSYTVTSSPDGRTCTAAAPARACTVSGLRNGRAYRFSVVATNGEGSGAAATSATVTPKARPTVKVLSTTSAGGALRTWMQVSGPGTITQVGTSPAIKRRVCRAALTVRKAGRVLIVCTPGRRARTLLPCRPVKVRLSTVFSTPDRVKRTTVREARLDACLRVAAVTG